MYPIGNNIIFRLFGKSHGEHVGCVLEGVPAGIRISEDEIKRDMDLRRPKDGIGTPRKEDDIVEITSGIVNGFTDGTPIRIIIANKNVDSSKYENIAKIPRPGHADLPAMVKWKDHDVRGGGQFSGRLTAPIVAAGSIAKQMLYDKGIQISAFTRSIGNVRDNEMRCKAVAGTSKTYATRACSEELDIAMREEILNASKDGDSVGGVVECIVRGLPIGFGGIWFDSLDAVLSRAMFGIPAVKGVEFGKGFEITKMRGSESNDQYYMDRRDIRARTNNMGGIVGGMSNGMPMVFRVAFKPTPSISKEQESIDLTKMKNAFISVKGRHDPCIVPRAVSVVEAMTALVLADVSMDDVEPEANLDTLRKIIEDIDAHLVQMMICRNDTAGLIGEVKKGTGVQLRNKDVEKKIIERYRTMAENTSLPKDVAEAVCKLLITSSVELQSSVLRKECGKNVTIIGGAGRMGQWMRRYFESMNATVRIVDISVGSMDDAKDADIVIVAVPIPLIEDILREADAVCKKDALIFDIASIKSPFSVFIKELAKRRKVCSVHPMFGPSAASLTDRNVIVCDCGNDDAVTEAKELFDNDCSNVTVTTVERHDELMAFAMSLAHASNIAFFTALKKSGIPFSELRDAASTTFNRTMSVSADVSEEDPALYHLIQRTNANAEEMWKVYENAVKEVKKASLSKNDERFREIMEGGKQYLNGDP
ncbi:MAG: chorismate synthase [Methanomassiliicoccaceae archaeon]|jgi:chorismate synthase|nr:chorismate synthase [Methanomassiliicoccaceae archaeon]